MYVHSYIRTYIHTYTHTYVRTYTHTHTHTHKASYSTWAERSNILGCFINYRLPPIMCSNKAHDHLPTPPPLTSKTTHSTYRRADFFVWILFSEIDMLTKLNPNKTSNIHILYYTCVYCTIQKLNPNVDLNYKILSCLKCLSLKVRYFGKLDHPLPYMQ